MDCRVILGELFAYTLGTSSEEERERIDEHLVACTSCLRAYLRVKRHVEREGALGARPSDETRRRIRADVAAIVRPRGAARIRHWLRRPIPLYQGLAVAAVAAGVAIGLPQALASIEAGKKAPETTARVDMSRPLPQALAIY
ncbi:MAG: zf-HC2 domain-containing protein [Polyangiaceae bacterium]|jgi:anti-sigma factor RsiW